jgi:hypothetical protein
MENKEPVIASRPMAWTFDNLGHSIVELDQAGIAEAKEALKKFEGQSNRIVSSRRVWGRLTDKIQSAGSASMP